MAWIAAHKRLVSLLLPLLALLLGVAVADRAAASVSDNWDIVCLECRVFSNGTDRAIQLDGKGNLRLVYGGDHLYLATRSGGEWETEVVDSSQNVGSHASLAVGGPDRTDLHIAYFDALKGNLKYARFGSGGWTIETVDSVGNVGLYTSIAVGGDGRVWISYHDAGNGALKVAHGNGGAWTREVVHQGDKIGLETSIAVDGNNIAHIAYYHAGTDDLRYAKRTGSSWTLEAVDTGGDVGRTPSIAVDSANLPHISYYDQTNTALKYARRSASSWTRETVFVSGNVGLHTSIALDSSDIAHISYQDVSRQDTRYVRRDGSSWIFEIVDSTAEYGAYATIVLDQQENPVVAYYRERGLNRLSELLAAVRDNGTWQPAPIDASVLGQVLEVEVAVGPDDLPRAAYRLGDLLFFARWTGSTWEKEVVDNDVTGLGLALDTNGNPRIAYHKKSSGIRYAVKTGSAWSDEPALDFVTGSAVEVALALDSANFPHILFQRANTLGYLNLDGQEWIAESVDSRINPGDELPIVPGLAIDVDASGSVYVAYHGGQEFMKFAKRNDFGWDQEILYQGSGRMRRTVSLELDSSRRIHVAFVESNPGSRDLWYAASADGRSWARERIVPTGTPGEYHSMVLDRQGVPHIIYRDDLRAQARYAARSGPGQWPSAVVDSTGRSVPWIPDLALDGDGKAHAVYKENSSFAVRYAKELPPTPQNPAPVLSKVYPSSATVGGRSFFVYVYGSSFVPGAVVRFGRASLPTFYVSSGKLRAYVSSTYLRTATKHLVSVVNPTPGGGPSALRYFYVNFSKTGVSTLTPEEVTVFVGAATLHAFTWTHPDENWRALDTLEIRFTDDSRQTIRIRLDEGKDAYGDTSTLNLLDEDGDVVASGKPGDEHTLKHEGVALNLANSSLQGSGPGVDDRSLDLILDLTFDNSVQGALYNVEIYPINDDGESQPAELVGIRTVLPTNEVFLPLVTNR